MTSRLQSLEDLESAEAFLEAFEIPYEQHVVDVCRLHILQRARAYLSDQELAGLDEPAQRAALATVLQRAYDDFVASDPLTERVFKVLRDAPGARSAPTAAFVPLSDIRGVASEPSTKS